MSSMQEGENNRSLFSARAGEPASCSSSEILPQIRIQRPEYKQTTRFDKLNYTFELETDKSKQKIILDFVLRRHQSRRCRHRRLRSDLRKRDTESFNQHRSLQWVDVVYVSRHIRHSIDPTPVLRSLETNKVLLTISRSTDSHFHFAGMIMRTEWTRKHHSQSSDAFLFRWRLAFGFPFTHRERIRTNLKDKQRVNDQVEFWGILLEQNNSREHWHKKTRSLLISFYSWFSLSLRV